MKDKRISSRSLCVFSLLPAACAAHTESPRTVTPAPLAPVVSTQVPAAAPAPSSATVASSAVPRSAARDLVAHDYRKIFDDYGSIVFHDGRPLLFAMQGAVDLSTGRVLFERMASNGGVYEGDSLWYADGFSPMSACPEPSVLVQLQGDKWLPRRDMNVHALFVQAWLPGSSLAAVVPRRRGPPWGYELTVLEKNRTPPVPERAGKRRDPSCHTRIADLEAFLAFPSGEILAFGRQCPLVPEPVTDETEGGEATDDDGAPALVVESWAAKASRSSFATLPFRELSSVRGVGPRDVWATGSLEDGKHAFAHYDGASWALGAERFDDAIESLFIPSGESGSKARRYFIAKERLLELTSTGLMEHAVPDDCRPLAIEMDHGQLWLSCGTKFGMALFTTDPAAAPFAFPAETPQESYVTWREQALPPLDPKGPRVGCGPRSAEHEFDGSSPGPSSGKVRHKPSVVPPKPQPSRGGSKVKARRLVDFGY